MAITIDGKLEHVGAVLALRRHYMYDDDRPYFTADVWSDDHVATVSASWSDTVDATDDVIALAREWQYHTNILPMMQEQLVRDAQAVAVGKRVEILGGRKYRGQVGVVVWTGECASFSGRGTEQRTRIQPDNGDAFFVPTYYCQVVEWWDYLSDYDAAVAEARAIVDRYYAHRGIS